MNEQKLKKELKDLGYDIKVVMKFNKEGAKIIADRQNAKERYFLKCFNLRDIFKSPSIKKWVNNEIKMGELLSSSSYHTGVTLIEKVYTQNYLIMVYEYYKHRTLEQIITEKKLRDRDIKLLLRDLVRILEDLRKLGLIHKHLSPDKIIVANNSMLKFTGLDFLHPVGTTTVIHNEQIIKHFANINCIPPELALNKFIGFKTQVFSFGVILYLITHGFWPYESSSLKQLRNYYLDNDYKPFIDPNLHPKIYYLIQKTIAVDYNDRIGLTEIKKEIYSMYKGIKHDEDNIRSKLYNIRNPNMKAVANIIKKKINVPYEMRGKIFGAGKNEGGMRRTEMSINRILGEGGLPPLPSGFKRESTFISGGDEPGSPIAGGKGTAVKVFDKNFNRMITLKNGGFEASGVLSSSARGPHGSTFLDRKLARYQKLTYKPLKIGGMNSVSLPKLKTAPNKRRRAGGEDGATPRKFVSSKLMDMNLPTEEAE